MTAEQLGEIVDWIEVQVGRQGHEVNSRVIGELVVERLRTLDEVAYVRFASVYRDFTHAGEFRRELERLHADPGP